MSTRSTFLLRRPFFEGRFSPHKDGRRFACSDADGILHIFGLSRTGDFQREPYDTTMKLSRDRCQIFTNEFAPMVWDVFENALDQATQIPVMLLDHLPILDQSEQPLSDSAQEYFRQAFRPLPVVRFDCDVTVRGAVTTNADSFAMQEIDDIASQTWLRLSICTRRTSTWPPSATRRKPPESLAALNPSVGRTRISSSRVFPSSAQLTSRQKTLRIKTRFEQSLASTETVEIIEEVKDDDRYLGLDEAFAMAEAEAVAAEALGDELDKNWAEYSGSEAQTTRTFPMTALCAHRNALDALGVARIR